MFADYDLPEVITAMVTPMQQVGDDVEIDFDAAAKLAVYLIEEGNDSLVLSGTTGEAPTTHLDEKGKLIEVVRAALENAFPGRHIPLIAGTGSNDTQHAIRNTEVAKNAGADAVLVVTPYYSRPSQEGIIAHFKAVAASTNLPVILYDVPARTGVKLEMDTYIALMDVPNIVGVKDASGDLDRASRIIETSANVRARHELNHWQIYAGDDNLLLEFLQLGAVGIISVAGHFIGHRFKQTIKLLKQNDADGAKLAYDDLLPIIAQVNSAGQQARDVKTLLQATGKIPNRIMRLPNLAVSDEELNKIDNGLIMSIEHFRKERLQNN
jgi:4-hydroxy-tetrahydrodipicolinate synthase